MRDGVFRARFALAVAALAVALAIALVWLVATRSGAPDEDMSAVARAGIASPRGAEAPDAPLAAPGVPEDVPVTATGAGDADSSPPAAPKTDPTIWTRGRVVDERTGEGVGFAEVVLTAGKLEVRDLTAEDGSFAMGDPGFERAPAALVVDPPGPEGTTLGAFAWSKETHDAGGWNLAVPIGPTYFLGGRWVPVGPGEVDARLIESPPEDPNESLLLVSPTGLDLAPRTGTAEPRDWPWIPVRAGAREFVRYPRQLFEPSKEHEAFLSVRSFARSARGRAPVASTVGIHREVVVLYLEPYVALRGRVASAKGDPIAGADVFLTDTTPVSSRDSVGSRPPQWNHARTDAKGAFEIEGAFPIHAIACAVAEGYPISYHLVRAGAPPGKSRNEFALKSRRGADEKSRAYSGSAGHATFVLAEFGPFGGPVFGRRGVRSPDDGGLTFGVLPEETHALRVIVATEEARDTPIEELGLAQIDRVRAPIDHLIRRSSDPSSHRPFRCEARDRVSKSAIEDVAVVFGPSGCVLGALRPGDPAPSPTRETPLVWTAWAEGYAPARGTNDDLEPIGKRLVADVALARGWGASLHLRACDPTEPKPDPRAAAAMEGWHGATALAGAFVFPAPGPAEIHAPGVGRLEAIDGRGDVFVTLTFLPSTLEVVCEGWRIRRIERFPRGDAPPVFPFEYVVWMERKLVY